MYCYYSLLFGIQHTSFEKGLPTNYFYILMVARSLMVISVGSTSDHRVTKPELHGHSETWVIQILP